MDPGSAIGIVGLLISLADVAGKTIHKLSHLRTKYQNADLAVAALIGQLCTIKAALTELGSHQNARLENLECHLSSAVEGCSLLIESVDERIAQLERKVVGRLSSKGKASFLWAEKDLGDCLAMLDRQVHALNLLLLATQW